VKTLGNDRPTVNAKSTVWNFMGMSQEVAEGKMKRLILAFLMVFVTRPLFAQDASTAWRNVIKKCAKSDLIGRDTLFFGVSNTIGPGSVWRFADDRSIRLMFELSDAFPDQSDQSKVVKANNTAACLGSATSSWNIKLGLPFSTGATPLTLDIGVLLGQAKKVTVSISGFALDDIKETEWKEAFKGLAPDSPYAKEILQDNRVVAENAVKVTGFKAVFDYKTNFSVDVQGKYKGLGFILGNSSAGKDNQSGGSASKIIDTVSKDATSIAGAISKNGKTTSGSTAGSGPCSSSSGAPSKGATSNKGATPSNGEKTTSSGTPSNGASPSTGGGTTKGGSVGTGSATLHVDFTKDNQITVCADGPFYLIAAYSKLINGTPIGITPTAASLTLVPATIPTGAILGSDRQQ
jgi:hypothetical protein